jgi:nitroreductase
MMPPDDGIETMTHPLLASRWSPSIFDPAHEVTGDEVASLLTAAQWAPSAGNSQPWAYVVCRRGGANHRRFVAHLSRGNSVWVPTASVVFVTLCQVATDAGADTGPDAPTYSDYAAYDVGQAAAHLTIEARALGLDAHQFAGFDHEAVLAEFEIPLNFAVLTGIAVGRHGDEAVVAAASERDQERELRARTRRPIRLFGAGTMQP